MKHILYLFVVCFLLCGCSFSTQKDQQKPLSSDTLSYATGLTIDTLSGYTRVSLLSFDQSSTQVTNIYYLVSSDTVQVPSDGLKIKVPVERVVLGSCTQIGFLSELKQLDKVVGVCNADRVYHSELLQKLSQGKITDVGDAFTIEKEKLLHLHPDVVFLSGFDQMASHYSQLSDMGIPIVYINEWREGSLLGRAEWIKMMALFFSQADLGKKIFAEIEQNYIDYQKRIPSQSNRPSVLWGDDFRGSWYFPLGDSFNASILKDAGADYYYQNTKGSGSVALSMEEVLKHFHDADVWIGCASANFQELNKSNRSLSMIRAVQNKKVYNWNHRTTSTGGNDYWESGVILPHLILRDILKVLYPANYSQEPFYFIRPLE